MIKRGYELLFPGATSSKARAVDELIEKFIYDENHEEFKKSLKENNIEIPDYIYKDLKIVNRCFLYQKDSNEKKDQKILVIFYGNDSSVKKTLEQIAELLKTFNKYDNIAFVNYPSEAESEDRVIERGYFLIRSLVKELGYKKENIDVLGRSMGGAVSARVLKKLKDDDIQVNHYVNVNSFSEVCKLRDNKSYVHKRVPEKALPFVNSILFSEFVLNAAEVVNNKENPVAKEITVCYREDDDKILFHSSLAKAVNNEEVVVLEYEGGDLQKTPHNRIDYELVQKILFNGNKEYFPGVA